MDANAQEIWPLFSLKIQRETDNLILTPEHLRLQFVRVAQVTECL